MSSSSSHALTTDSRDSIAIALTGSGGAGVMTAGSILLNAAGQSGWYGCMTRSSGPQIRGGEAAALLRLSRRPTESHGDRFDVLLAIDWHNMARFAAELMLDGDSVVVGDPQGGGIMPDAIVALGARHYDVELKKIAKQMGGGRPNMLALGMLSALLRIPLTVVVAVLEAAMGAKGEQVLAASIAGVRRGAELAGAVALGRPVPVVERGETRRWRLTGNQATGLGAVRGGVRFVAAYPITPATDCLEWLAARLPRVGGVLLQAEDEMASINQVIGASFGGVPALTATSGPGLALMMESIGLAVTAEVPVVVVDVMRGGPSTGIPTKSEQSDLNLAVYGLHGDAPHVVVAPTSIADCMLTTQWAVHLAEALQTAAIVLSDQALGQTRAVIQRPAEVAFVARRRLATLVPNEPYRRYALTESGVSPMTLPGTVGGQYTADGLEHDELGTPSSQASNHVAQLEKRRRKLENHDFGEHWADIEGDGDTAVITWGSTCGPVREALAALHREGTNVRLVALRLLSPPQVDKLAAALAGVRRLLVVEQSHGRQFYRYLRAHYDLPAHVEVRPLSRPGPLPMRPGDIRQALHPWRH